MGNEVTFHGRVRRWDESKPGGLAVVDIPGELVGELGGRKQYRVEGTMNGASFGGSTMLVAGGGFTRGNVVGATDAHAAYVTDKYYKVESFGRTIYQLLGIDPDQVMYSTENRPHQLIVEDAPIIREALA